MLLFIFIKENRLNVLLKAVQGKCIKDRDGIQGTPECKSTVIQITGESCGKSDFPMNGMTVLLHSGRIQCSGDTTWSGD